VKPFSDFDHAMMRRALALAAKGMYTTTPNPRVGCVVTRGETVIGEGWHERAGGAHAEVLALRGIDAAGATVYVNLEPCNHQGRTPPCVPALVQSKVARVVAAMRDPNRDAAGGGEALAAAGIRFEHGLLEDEARELNIGFVSRVTRGRPWVRMKIAATLDGRTALEDGRSQWITGPEARRDGHRWRARASAVLTGIGTVRADDPQLTVRDVETPRQPLRVIIDSRLEAPHEARVLRGERVLVFAGRDGALPNAEVIALPNAQGKVDLPRMLEVLAQRGVNELHVEAGFRLNGSLVREGCVDEFLLYLNPSFLGDGALPNAEVVALPNPQGKVDLPRMLGVLSERGVNELHVEAGYRLNGSLVREGCVDEFLLYLNPSFLGDGAQGMLDLPALAALDARLRLRLLSVERLGDDLRLLARSA
jgi:diaminohydroxyphosphoribosylaminopyrimidine deaminase/5-amino-6-(5-phosphoribosylamino)uracil reductase